jgi:hypothetical protein
MEGHTRQGEQKLMQGRRGIYLKKSFLTPSIRPIVIKDVVETDNKLITFWGTSEVLSKS